MLTSHLRSYSYLIVPFFGLLNTFWPTPGRAQVSAISLKQQFMVDGVNCHGASLMAGGWLQNLSYVGQEEMEGILNQFCRKVGGPQAGAIGYIAGSAMVNHSFYVLDNRRIFQKRSADAISPLKVVEGPFPKNAQYYLCQVPPIESQCSKEVDLFVTRVKEFTQYYEGLLTELRDFQKREDVYREMKNLSEPNESHSCWSSLVRAKLRLASLLDLGYILNGQGLIMYQKNSPMKQRGK